MTAGSLAFLSVFIVPIHPALILSARPSALFHSVTVIDVMPPESVIETSVTTPTVIVPMLPAISSTRLLIAPAVSVPIVVSCRAGSPVT